MGVKVATQQLSTRKNRLTCTQLNAEIKQKINNGKSIFN